MSNLLEDLRDAEAPSSELLSRDASVDLCQLDEGELDEAAEVADMPRQSWADLTCSWEMATIEVRDLAGAQLGRLELSVGSTAADVRRGLDVSAESLLICDGVKLEDESVVCPAGTSTASTIHVIRPTTEVKAVAAELVQEAGAVITKSKGLEHPRKTAAALVLVLLLLACGSNLLFVGVPGRAATATPVATPIATSIVEPTPTMVPNAKPTPTVEPTSAPTTPAPVLLPPLKLAPSFLLNLSSSLLPRSPPNLEDAIIPLESASDKQLDSLDPLGAVWQGMLAGAATGITVGLWLPWAWPIEAAAGALAGGILGGVQQLS